MIEPTTNIKINANICITATSVKVHALTHVSVPYALFIALYTVQ